MSRLQGKVALLTGGTGGFGVAITEKLISEGAKVVLVDLSPPAISQPNTVFVQGDVSKPETWQKALDASKETFGQLDIVVNNAGIITKNTPTHLSNVENLDKIMNVNVKPIFVCANIIIPYFMERGVGNIINLASTAAIRPRPGLAYYNTSKGAVVVATKTLAAEYASYQIRVNAIAPAIAGTAMLEPVMGKSDTPENRQPLINSIPLGRLCEPKDIANMTAFLASEESNFITGCVYEVDGGRSV